MISFVLFLTLTAATKAGVTMPDKAVIHGKELILNGLGVREATVFNVEVYVAGLYLEKASKNEKWIIGSESVKHLVLRFVRDVDRDDLTDAWEDGFEKTGWGKLEAQVARLNGWMKDMKVGQELAFTYVPTKGVAIAVDGRAKGWIRGADFAKAMFAIFVGPEPPNKGLKRGLLGG